MQNNRFGSKIQNAKNEGKNDCMTILELLSAKKPLQKTPNDKKFLKMVSLGQKLKMPKKCESDCTTTLELLCAKNRSKKPLIFEKSEHFENGQNWPICMGYSPRKMVSLGQKLKNAKKVERTIVQPH